MSANPFCTPPLEGMVLLAVIFCDTFNGTMGNTPGNGETLAAGALGMAVKNSWRSPLPLVTVMCFAVISVAPPNVSSMCCSSINCCVAILTPSTATLVVASNPPPVRRRTVPAGRYPPPGVTLRNHMAPPQPNGTSLNAQGYEIRVANDGETALEIVKDFAPDLVITDLAMPNMNGIELCRRLRKMSQVPILVLSVRGEERSKIEALDSGADDYVTKPFSTGELLARIRAALRRSPPSNSAVQSKIDLGDFHIDLDAHSIAVAAREVRLTPKEFDVLRSEEHTSELQSLRH